MAEEKAPKSKKSHLYDRIEISLQGLNWFIVGVISLLLVVILVAFRLV